MLSFMYSVWFWKLCYFVSFWYSSLLAKNWFLKSLGDFSLRFKWPKNSILSSLSNSVLEQLKEIAKAQRVDLLGLISFRWAQVFIECGLYWFYLGMVDWVSVNIGLCLDWGSETVGSCNGSGLTRWNNRIGPSIVLKSSIV